MKNKFISFCLLSSVFCFFASCSNQVSLQQQFSDCQKISFSINTGGDVPEVYDEINDPEKMKNWIDYIDEKGTVKDSTCAYPGKLILFFTETDSLVMQFSLPENCNEIKYSLDGGKTFHHKPFTKAGQDYINHLQTVSRSY